VDGVEPGSAERRVLEAEDGRRVPVLLGSRYLFTTVDLGRSFARDILPNQMLAEIGKATAWLGLARELEPGELFRARYDRVRGMVRRMYPSGSSAGAGEPDHDCDRQCGGECQEDGGFDGLECPVAAGWLVGDVDVVDDGAVWVAEDGALEDPVLGVGVGELGVGVGAVEALADWCEVVRSEEVLDAQADGEVGDECSHDRGDGAAGQGAQ
jgi:hypothetical protein